MPASFSAKVTITERNNVVQIDEEQVLVRVEEQNVAVYIDASGGRSRVERRNIINVTEDFDIGTSQSGASFSNVDATQDIEGTLPALSDCEGGEVYRFRSRSPAYFLKVSAAGSDTILMDGSEVSYVRSQEDQACIEVENQGDAWLVCEEETGLWLIGE